VHKVDEAFRIEPLELHKKKFVPHSVPIQDAFNVGVYFITPLFAGMFVGNWADNRFNTKPMWLVVGLLFGFIGSVFNLIKFVRKFTTHA